jgi:cytochrome P450
MPMHGYPSMEGAECPYPFYDTWRKEAPVHALPDRPNIFVLSRYEDVKYVVSHPEIFSSVGSRSGLNGFGNVGEPTMGGRVMIESDPPFHKAKRDLAFKPLKPGRLKGYEDMIRGFVDQLIDTFAERGEADLIADFGDKLPIHVISHILGLPPEDHDYIRAWGRAETSGLTWMPQEFQDKQRGTASKMGDYLTDKLLERVDDPGDDMLSQMIQAQIRRDGEFNLDDVRGQAGAVLAGGVLTTAHSIGSTVLLLLSHAEELERVKADFGRLETTINEAIRVESPIQWVPRVAGEDHEVGGTLIPKGSYVLIMWAAANRDPDFWEEPEAFNPDRPKLKNHVAFGYGIHFCLGAPLARLESRLAIEGLLTRLPDLRISDANDFQHIPSPSFRGLRRLLVEFTPVRAVALSTP